MTHGIEMEPYARKQFEVVSGLSVETCGLIVDREIAFLAASPSKTIFLYNILAYMFLLLYYYISNFQMVLSVMMLFLK